MKFNPNMIRIFYLFNPCPLMFSIMHTMQRFVLMFKINISPFLQWFSADKMRIKYLDFGSEIAHAFWGVKFRVWKVINANEILSLWCSSKMICKDGGLTKKYFEEFNSGFEKLYMQMKMLLYNAVSKWY